MHVISGVGGLEPGRTSMNKNSIFSYGFHRIKMVKLSFSGIPIRTEVGWESFSHPAAQSLIPGPSFLHVLGSLRNFLAGVCGAPSTQRDDPAMSKDIVIYLQADPRL